MGSFFKTWDQKIAQFRHVASFVGGMLVALGIFTQVDINTLIDATIKIGTALGSIAAAIGVIMPIVSSLWAGKTAAPEAQIAKVAALADVPTAGQPALQQEAKEALVSATAALPEVSKVKLEQSAPQSMVDNTPPNVKKDSL